MTRDRARVVAIVLGCAAIGAAPGGCKTRGPNSAAPEDQLLYELGNAVAGGDRERILALYDLDARQRLEAWEHDLKPLQSPEKQAEAFSHLQPRLGDKAALATVGDEAVKEVAGAAWADELGTGKCVSGPVSKEDIGRGVMPKERKEMPQEVGMFIFELRTSVNWLPTFRVTCPTAGSFWIQMAQRKRTDPAKEQPLRVVRVSK